MLVLLGELLNGDLVIVIVVVLVLGFAGPRLARNLGLAKKEFDKSVKTNTPKKSDDEVAEQ